MQTFEERIMPIIQGAKGQGFKAGAASRQEEVDKLQTEIDELQKRINDALRVLEEDTTTLIEQTEKIYGILKGDGA